MDKCSTDAEFDSYWDYEAKNKNRNRIRVGRQFQASIPPLLKPGEKDGRKSSELETLKWKPDQLTEKEIEDYLSMAKSIGLFSKSLGSNPPEKSDNTLQSAIKGLSEFVTSHHPYHHDDGCKVAKPSCSAEPNVKPPNDWTPSEVQLFAQALEACGKNFCAIKKDFLPWKPVRSLIEYYYQGKNEKPEDQVETPPICSPKKEDEPTPSCSKDEKPCVKDESVATRSPKKEEPPSPAVTFLENSRATDPCGATSEPTITVNTDSATMASTVGSLKFFLGGRLVLKLNAQQDSGSGTKCQWVQSNEIAKNAGARKERHRRKCIPDGSVAVSSPESKPRKIEVPEPSQVTKKPKLRSSEYDFTADDSQLLCSSSWTPPVADGREAIEIDDCSSKTSEGYVSPILSRDVNDSKWDHEASWLKSERPGSSQDCLDGAPRTPYKGSPNGSPYKSEVLNHKSALRSPVRGHRSSPLLRPWSKWNNVATYPSSPCSLSPVSVTDSKSPLKENPLDLSSKPDHTMSSNHLDKANTQPTKTSPSDRELDSPLSSNPSRCTESPSKDSPKCCINTDSLPCEGCPKGCGCSSEGETEEAALYCNLPYHCALNKCTKDYSLEEVPLDLSSASESLNERTEVLENATENNLKDGSAQNAEAVERGMLYQLLKNSSK